MLRHLPRWLFHILVVRPFLAIAIGLHVREAWRLPRRGPAIIVANHNSHLDSLVIASLFPLRALPSIRPVAAAEYFLRNSLIAWFATEVIGIVPLSRHPTRHHGDPLAGCEEALRQNSILVLFPEGTRGDPEKLSGFKRGVGHLAERCPDVPIHPVFLAGLGRSLPKGGLIPVPFFCDIFVGELTGWQGTIDATMRTIEARMADLSLRAHIPAWEDDDRKTMSEDFTDAA